MLEQAFQVRRLQALVKPVHELLLVLKRSKHVFDSGPNSLNLSVSIPQEAYGFTLFQCLPDTGRTDAIEFLASFSLSLELSGSLKPTLGQTVLSCLLGRLARAFEDALPLRG